MSNKTSVLFGVVTLLILVACEKDEIPIAKRAPGNVITTQVEMGSDYADQLFYSLSNNRVVSQNKKTDWDLGFEATTDGWHIVLNTARGGAAANTGKTDVASVSSVNDAEWRWDAHSGNLDSTAIGDYRGKNEVYLIDRGYDELGTHTGYRKIVLLDVTETYYSIKVAELDGTNETTIRIEKDTTVNFVSFSFNQNKVVSIQPPKQEWDLLFTQYIHLFEDPPVPYLVTGVLINRNLEATAVYDKPFEEISFDNVDQYSFSKAINVIGYDWKEYSFNAGSYVIFPEKNYIVKSHEGRYFKLHFIDFYNENGDKGAPLMEIQEL
jgi:hypothetical protein